MRGPIRLAAVTIPSWTRPLVVPGISLAGGAGGYSQTAMGPFCPAGAMWMCAICMSRMSSTISQYLSPAAVSSKEAMPPARDALGGTSSPPQRNAT